MLPKPLKSFHVLARFIGKRLTANAEENRTQYENRAWSTQPSQGKAHVIYTFRQRRIFIFGDPGYFKLWTLLDGLRRLMSYKLALHVPATFTEQVVSIQKRISLLYSEFPRHQEQKQSQ